MRLPLHVGIALSFLAGCAAPGGFRPPEGGRTSDSPNFRLVSAAPAEATRLVMEAAEEAWQVYREMLGPLEGRQLPATIHLYRTNEEFQKSRPTGISETLLTPQTRSALGVAAVYHPARDTLGIVAENEEAVRAVLPILRHELMHAWLTRAVGGNVVPEYLQEGMAYHIGWTAWPPAGELVGKDEADMVLEAEAMAWFGITVSVQQMLETPTIVRDAMISGGWGVRGYYTTSALLMRMLLRDPGFKGFIPALFKRYRAWGGGTAGESCSVFRGVLQEFLPGPAGIDARLETFMVGFRTKVLSGICQGPAECLAALRTTTLVPMVAGRHAVLDGTTWKAEDLTFARDPSRALPVAVDRILQRGTEVGKRADACPDGKAPPELVAEVRESVKSLADVLTFYDQLRTDFGATALMQLDAAVRASRPGSGSLEQLRLDAQLCHIHLDAWVSRQAK